MKFRKHYDYDTKAASIEAEIPFTEYGESLTIQSMAEDADINVMMARFKITGQMPQGVRVPEYGDFTEVTDYRTGLLAIMDAQENFMRLPANVRAQFENDPQQFLDYASDPKNIDGLRKMGLAKELPNDESKGSPGAPDPAAGAKKGETAGGT